MIDEHEVARLLRAATDDIAVPVAPARALAAVGSRRRRRRWVVGSLATVTAVAVVAVAVPVALSSERSGRTAPAAHPTTTAPGASCVDPVPSRVLPGWARTGFTDPRPRMPYVLGDNGAIAAILFVRPLTAPPSPDHSNKILWVSRVDDGGSSMRVTATLADGSATATRVVDGGPGPSIIDLPEPGCWHLTLQWGDNVDTLDLAYVTP
jgi:hypothetical protein